MALDLKVSSLFGNRGGINTILRETYFKIGDALVIDVAGPPSDDLPEGTLVVNTVENRLYVRIKGSSSQPVTHFKLNETGGTAVTDAGSGGHNGVASSAEWVTGKYENGFNTSVSEEISIASNADFDIGNQTIEMWVKWDSFAIDTYLYHRIVAGAPPNSSVALLVDNSGNLSFNLYNKASGTDSVSIALTDFCTIGEWYHIVGRADVTNSKISLWVDGEMVDEAALTEDLSGMDTAVYLGSENGGTRFWHDGVIDEFKFFKSVRTQAQIKNDSLKSAGLVWSYTSLTGA